MRNKSLLITLMLVILALATTGCGGARAIQETSEAQETSRADIRIVVVTHGQASDPFWSVVRKGVEQAAQDMGVRVEYQSPDTFDMAEMAQLIDDAVASQPDGLVVSIPDADALSPSIRAAIAADIPVISINSGSEVAEELGVLTHIGQTEYEAGFAGGRRMAAAGVRNALCVNQEIGNRALDLRCEGLADALAQVGGSSDAMAVDPTEPSEVRERVLMALAAMPDVDGILALGPTASLPILEALREEGFLDEIKLATFDLAPGVLEAISDGEMLFAIDQQQYLQGYLPIVMLTLYNINANTPASAVMPTGPGFVTEENVNRVIDLSAAGTR